MLTNNFLFHYLFYMTPTSDMIDSLSSIYSSSKNSTMPPTYHPTPHGEPFIVKGTVWYDRNANGNRDTGVSMTDFGSDVEYNLGLGGVKVALVECNADTNR